MTDDLKTANATLKGLETLVDELVSEAEERNRANADVMYDTLLRIIDECRNPTPDTVYIKRLAEAALQAPEREAAAEARARAILGFRKRDENDNA